MTRDLCCVGFADGPSVNGKRRASKRLWNRILYPDTGHFLKLEDFYLPHLKVFHRGIGSFSVGHAQLTVPLTEAEFLRAPWSPPPPVRKAARPPVLWQKGRLQAPQSARGDLEEITSRSVPQSLSSQFFSLPPWLEWEGTLDLGCRPRTFALSV